MDKIKEGISYLSELWSCVKKLTPWIWLNIYMRDKVFTNGPSEIFGRRPLKTFKVTWSVLADNITSNFLKGCPPQISLDPFLNNLSHISIFLIHILRYFLERINEMTFKKKKRYPELL